MKTQPMTADDYMTDLAKRLKSSRDLDPEIVDLIVEKLFNLHRDRDVASALETEVEAIALRRASSRQK